MRTIQRVHGSNSVLGFGVWMVRERARDGVRSNPDCRDEFRLANHYCGLPEDKPCQLEFSRPSLRLADSPAVRLVATRPPARYAARSWPRCERPPNTTAPRSHIAAATSIT